MKHPMLALSMAAALTLSGPALAGPPPGQDTANWLHAEQELYRAAVLDDEVKHKAAWVDLEGSDITYLGLTSTFI